MDASSDIGSDEIYDDNLISNAEDTPMVELDTGPVDLDNLAPMEVDCEAEESNADEFTGLPSGLDLGPDYPIGDPRPSVVVEEYPGAAEVIEDQKDLYAQIWEADELFDSRKTGGPYYPFSGAIEWEVVEWLHSLNVPMKKVNEFLRLNYVSSGLNYVLVDF